MERVINLVLLIICLSVEKLQCLCYDLCVHSEVMEDVDLAPFAKLSSLDTFNLFGFFLPIFHLTSKVFSVLLQLVSGANNVNNVGFNFCLNFIFHLFQKTTGLHMSQSIDALLSV